MKYKKPFASLLPGSEANGCLFFVSYLDAFSLYYMLFIARHTARMPESSPRPRAR